jgi:uroporphyrinogen-III decarboxylase
MKLHAGDYFDLERYHARLERNRRAWGGFMAGQTAAVAFINLCAPSLCAMFDVPFDAYYTDLATMADTQLRGIAWRLENLDEDELPQAVFLDQATVYEALAFSLPVQYRSNSPPWGERLLHDPDEIDHLELPCLVDHTALGRTQQRLEQMRELVAGLPVLTSVHLHAPFTLAAQLFGAQELYLLCLEEPERAHRLLDFCVAFFRHFERVKWQYGLSPEPLDEFVCWRGAQRGLTRVWVSDDCAPAVSPALYARFVQPYNRALFADLDYVHLHMDGKWDHLLPQVAALKPDFVEVGGETDWAAAVEILGPQTILQGGVSGNLGLNGAPADCATATRRALETAAEKAQVVITVAQEPHPGTPPENMQAILATVRAWRAERLAASVVSWPENESMELHEIRLPRRRRCGRAWFKRPSCGHRAR